MPESVAFTYNGTNQCVATITNAQVGVDYTLYVGDPVSASDTQTAASTTLVLTVSDIGGYSGGSTFEAEVSLSLTGEFCGVTVLKGGGGGEYSYPASWAYDGVDTVTLTGTFEKGVTFYCTAGSTDAGGSMTFVGTGAQQTITNDTAVTGTPLSGGSATNVYAYVEDDATGDFVLSNRLFLPGVASAGFSGNPSDLTSTSVSRFFSGYRWRWALTDLDSATIALVDRVTSGKQVLRDLGKPWAMSGQAPSADPLLSITHTDGRPYLAAGVRLLYGFRDEGVDPSPPWRVRGSGIVLQVSEEANEDESVTKYVAYDPRQLLYTRPVRDAAANIAPASFDGVPANEVALTLLKRTIDTDGPVRIDAGEAWSGTTSWVGSIEELPAVTHTFEAPMSVGEAWDWLEEKGYMDITLDPIYDPVGRPGYLSDLTIEAEKGATRRNAIFAWDMGPRSVTAITRLEDGVKLANNVVARGGAGGAEASVVATDAGSIATFGNHFGLQIQVDTVNTDALDKLAAVELLFRKEPPETVAITPAVGRSPIPLQAYDVGDRVPVWASPRFRKPINGDDSPSRVRGIHLDVADDGYEDVGQLITELT